MGNDILIVSLDVGCRGVAMLTSGALGPTAMQYPVRMAALGIDATAAFERTGQKSQNTPGLGFHDTGVTLVTDEPVPGVPSISSERTLAECCG